MSVTETQSAVGEGEADLDLGDVLDAIRKQRRRVALDYLAREREGEFGDLVDYAAREIHGLGYSPKERKRLYVALYQNHLPRLDDYGVVEFDPDDLDSIRAGEAFDRTKHILDALRDAAEEEAVEAESPRPITQTLSDILRGNSDPG